MKKATRAGIMVALVALAVAALVALAWKLSRRREGWKKKNKKEKKRGKNKDKAPQNPRFPGPGGSQVRYEQRDGQDVVVNVESGKIERVLGKATGQYLKKNRKAQAEARAAAGPISERGQGGQFVNTESSRGRFNDKPATNNTPKGYVPSDTVPKAKIVHKGRVCIWGANLTGDQCKPQNKKDWDRWEKIKDKSPNGWWGCETGFAEVSKPTDNSRACWSAQ